jgi:pyruvate,water dikinase
MATTRPGIVAVPRAHASAAVFAGPTWEETCRAVPVPVPAPARATATAPVDAAPDAEHDPLEDLHRRLETIEQFGPDAPLGWFRRRRIDRAVEGAVDHLGRREHTKAAVLELGGEVRRVHLEFGARLVARGVLEDRADVDLLSWREIEAGLRGAGPAPGIVARRRRWIRRYHDEGPLPVRFRGRPERQIPSLPAGHRLEGWAASAGRCRDRAVFMDEPDDSLPIGAILLAEATDASWSPVFVRAGAIVLERGGPLSHAAILARELGVPAVLNVGAAVRSLDGRVLTVDGSSGIVVVHDDATDGDDR